MSAADRQERETGREPPFDLWDEGGETLWLRRDAVPTAGKARYVAITGRGLPVEFGDGSLLELRCRARYMRPNPDENPGWTDELWTECDKAHPEAVAYWRLEWKPPRPAPVRVAHGGPDA